MNKQFIPEYDPTYVRWGNFVDVLKIIESKKFYPCWITGLSGNGKTQMIEQACALAGIDKKFFDPIVSKDKNERARLYQEKDRILDQNAGKYGREFIRVNFTIDTDEIDLIGGIKLDLLNDGKDEVGTVFQDGPVVTALRKGAVLLLDEVDIGHTNKIMCLQSVLEGKGVLIKATGEFVKPAPGFQVFATSNTKGKGSDNGMFMGANIMNSAFIDRFAGMMFQDYPPKEIEQTILEKCFPQFHWADHRDKSSIKPEEIKQARLFISKLCEWASYIRKTVNEIDEINEVITTRTLINIIKGYSIFGDKLTAIGYALERYPESIGKQFMQYYTKIDPDILKDDNDLKDI